ncbi:MAG: metallophosphoesterase [Candidatus Aminicenantes bacterium]|nr:metallophosphoesterase [Candidatus Aminicenantes bacterium]
MVYYYLNSFTERSTVISTGKRLNCFFVSDLHGRIERYQKLFDRMIQERPDALFIGGDLLPSPFRSERGVGTFHQDFIMDFLVKELKRVKESLGESYPRVFVILGNDDGKMAEIAMWEAEKKGVWTYCHFQRIQWGDFTVYGYAYVPPTPFRLKDWERFDVTDYVRPGCIAPNHELAVFTVRVNENELRSATIEHDLKKLTGNESLEKSIFLFHSPPHRSKLDRAGLDGRRINDLQVDVHVGSAAILRFIEKRQPLLTLHGHIHESTRITGSWKDTFRQTISFNASHDGPELSLIRFDPYCLEKASRELIR